ncbi:hypothetical protein SB658_24975, partial [Bacillus sp. SIMBA_008]
APPQAIALVLVGPLAAIPFCAIGLLIGSLVPASGAPAVVNLVYFPMSLLSGLWLPLAVLPKLFSTLAPLWPAWHLVQLAQRALGRPA